MKKNLPSPSTFFLLLLFCTLSTSALYAQTIQIVTNPSSSANVLIGVNNYHVSESIYTETEIGASNFTTAGTAIDHIDFNIAVVGANPVISTFKIYLKEVPLATTTLAVGVYNTTGYTLVYSGPFDASVTGWVGVDLTTPFIRTSGNNLELLIERVDGLPHAGSSCRSTNGNNTSSTVASSRRLNSATLPVAGTTVLNTATAFRPAIQLRHITLDDATVSQVYTIGKLPIPYSTPHVITANVKNNGRNPITNLNVTLDITGANTFTDVQTIPSLAVDASATVSFAAFSPTNIGSNTVSVSVPADDFNGDNNISITQSVTNNTYNYAYSAVTSGFVGFNTNSGDLLAKFVSNIPTAVNQVGVTFISGGNPFTIGIWDKSGTGLPGSLLWESAVQTSTTGEFTLAVEPSVAITDTFYVGVRQIGTTNLQFAYQSELPIRTNTFFFATPSGANTWTDFASTGSDFRFFIEPRFIIPNDVGITVINNPGTGTAIDNCGITPEVTVNNFGSNNQSTPFDVTFKIRQGGTEVYSDTKQVTLNAGSSQKLSFAPFIGAVTGSDSSFCYTSLATDGAPENDTIVNTFSTNDYSYGGGAAANGNYLFANSTSCASPSPFQPTYGWVTGAPNETEINWGNNGDDSVLATPITLPFTFSYFGIDYNQFWICSNGWISFSNSTAITPAVQKNPVTIRLAGGIENYIAGALTDLDMTTATYADAHTYYGGDANQFVITFQHAHRAGSATDFISFQIILKPTGDIFIQYNDAETTNPVPTSISNNCTAGIENADGTAGILYRGNGSRGPLFGSPLAVQFKPPVTTPVTLTNFVVSHSGKTNLINWSTSQEINSGYFVIEHSRDGRTFSALGKVTAAGNSSNTRTYAYSDNIPVKGINYYRLRIVDIDSKEKYSDIRNIRNEGTTKAVSYINPVRGTLKLNIASDQTDNGSIAITDMQGKPVYGKTISLSAGINTFAIDMNSVTAGTYIIKLELGDEVIIRKVTRL